MALFKVALLQLNPSNAGASAEAQKENLEKGIAYCRLAKELGADLALFPEMWNIGYTFNTVPSAGTKERGSPPEILESWKENAIDRESDFFTRFCGEAKDLNMAIALSYLEKWPGLPRNTVSLIDRFGNSIMTYAKVHTCDFYVEKYLSPGDDFYVADLDTRCGKIKTGAMICYDREFPESARILMLKGAEIILVPNACPIEINRKSQLRSRAFENMTGIAMTNYAGGKYDCNGHSLAFDGIAYGETSPDHFEARDSLIVEAGEAEGIFIAEFDMDKIRSSREREVWGNAFRKPKIYSMLVSETVEPPFKRDDARR
ncbi:MAG: carbon-nitrogen hydrolase family protein [Treponema sp.]|jgi:predicted amidohydrolase|nr:carbon-nitrogen hydrolase family protein [Treponema sp.]